MESGEFQNRTEYFSDFVETLEAKSPQALFRHTPETFDVMQRAIFVDHIVPTDEHSVCIFEGFCIVTLSQPTRAQIAHILDSFLDLECSFYVDFQSSTVPNGSAAPSVFVPIRYPQIVSRVDDTIVEVGFFVGDGCSEEIYKYFFTMDFSLRTIQVWWGLA